jgi:hypothetical protein
MERVNGRLRDECLNEHVFSSLAEARRIIEAWRIYYKLQHCASVFESRLSDSARVRGTLARRA